ncbi:MAG TPA: hypothetical protein PLI09_16670 [Candidatus Hydrogenedentes bacterium]|nr:hypothetical protein [Candidatus Hydrogenedentota bacterium]
MTKKTGDVDYESMRDILVALQESYSNNKRAKKLSLKLIKLLDENMAKQVIREMIKELKDFFFSKRRL